MSRSRALHALAWITVATHLAGLAFAATALRPGTPAAPAAERALAVGGQVAANGLYSIAVLLASLSAGRRSPPAFALGIATFAAGMALAGAGFSGDPTALAVAAALTVLLFVAWTVAMARAVAAPAA